MNRLAPLALFAVSALATSARCQGSPTWSRVGEIGGPLLWGASLAYPLLEDGRSVGWSHARKTFDALLVDGILTEGLKIATRERRPYSNSHDAFPSLHASLSFAAATAATSYHPGQGLVWYTAASLVAYSRVPAGEHHWQDVAAGAVLGYACGRWAVSSPHHSLGAPAAALDFSGLGLTLRASF